MSMIFLRSEINSTTLQLQNRSTLSLVVIHDVYAPNAWRKEKKHRYVVEDLSTTENEIRTKQTVNFGANFKWTHTHTHTQTHVCVHTYTQTHTHTHTHTQNSRLNRGIIILPQPERYYVLSSSWLSHSISVTDTSWPYNNPCTQGQMQKVTYLGRHPCTPWLSLGSSARR